MKGVSRDRRSKSDSGSGTPTRPAMAGRWTIAFVLPPIAMSTRIAFSKASRVRMPARAEVLRHHLDDPLPGRLGEREAPRVGGGDRRVAGKRHAEGLGHRGHGRGGAHDHAVPGRAREAALQLAPRLLVEAAGAELVPVAPDVRPRADLLGPEHAAEHRAAGDHDRRKVRARRAHQHGGRRLVAAREEHDAVEGQAPDALLHVHRHQVPEEHRRRLHEGLGERDHRELEREPPGAPDTPLDVLGDGPEVRVAVRRLAPGVRDPDDGPALEGVVGEPLRLHPGAMEEAVDVAPAEPALAAEPGRGHGRATLARRREVPRRPTRDTSLTGFLWPW